jgi:hypothetical protein
MMKQRIAALSFILGAALLPLLAQADTFRTLVEGKILPFADSIAGLLYALAFLFFLYCMLK